MRPRRVRVAIGLVAVLAALLVSPSTQAAVVKLRVGIVSAIDQLGVPIAVDRGFFEKWGLDVSVANPYATGVDLLNGLQAGDVQLGQVGVPMIGAVLRGMDLVIVGNYSGSSARLGGDNTMALVAREGSGLRPGGLGDLKGKRVAVAQGTISHLYFLGILARAGLKPTDVTVVNTAPPEMPVALRGGAVDAFAGWDPWPVIAIKDVKGAFEVTRGGNFIGFMGFIVALRPWAAQNGEIVERFLAARADADKWSRANAVGTAETAVRWLPGLRPEVALTGVRNNLPNIDIRISHYNFLALHNGEETLYKLGFIPGTFDVNKVFYPQPILNVMKQHPELFSDLPPIPRAAQVEPGYVFKPPAP